MNKVEMSEMLDDFILDCEDAEKSERTVEKYRRIVRNLLDDMPGSGEIRKADVIKWKKGLKKKYKDSTQRQYIIIVNKFLEYCATGEVDARSHESDLRVKNIRSQDNYTVNNVLTASEYMRMEKHAKKLGMYQTFLVMDVLAHTGIRFNELQFLTVEALKNKTQITVDNKGKTRQVTIPDATKRKINRYIKETGIDHGYIFTSARDPNKPLSKSTFWDRIQKIAGKARIGLDKAHAHSFRHLFAKALLAAGEDPAKIADVLGHSSIDTTRKYLRASDKEIKELMNKVKYSKMEEKEEEEE